MPSSAPITCRCRAMAPAAADGARRRAAGRRTWLRERSPRPRLGSTSPPSNPTEMSITATPNPAKVSVSWEEFAPGCQGSRLAPPGTWPVEGDGGCNARGIGAGGDRCPRARHKAYRNRVCESSRSDPVNTNRLGNGRTVRKPAVEVRTCRARCENRSRNRENSTPSLPSVQAFKRVYRLACYRAVGRLQSFSARPSGRGE